MIVRISRGCIPLVTITLALTLAFVARASVVHWPQEQTVNPPQSATQPTFDALAELITLMLGLPSSQNGSGGDALPVSFGQLVHGNGQFGGTDLLPGFESDPVEAGGLEFVAPMLPHLPGPGGLTILQGPHAGGSITLGTPKPGTEDPLSYLPGPIPLPPAALIGMAGLLALALRQWIRR